jgi:hypothetical protein
MTRPTKPVTRESAQKTWMLVTARERELVEQFRRELAESERLRERREKRSGSAVRP